MYPYDGTVFGLILMILMPVLLLGLLAWIASAVAQPREDTARRIARERFAKGEISQEELGVLLHAL